jgi:hypothetical protein
MGGGRVPVAAFEPRKASSFEHFHAARTRSTDVPAAPHRGNGFERELGVRCSEQGAGERQLGRKFARQIRLEANRRLSDA